MPEIKPDYRKFVIVMMRGCNISGRYDGPLRTKLHCCPIRDRFAIIDSGQQVILYRIFYDVTGIPETQFLNDSFPIGTDRARDQLQL